MSYIVPIHSPTSVRHALKLNLLSESEDCLVLAKSNWLEIWRQTPAGLVLDEQKRFQVHGKITMLQKVTTYQSKPSHLFVGTANRQYFTLSWNPDTDKLETVQTFQDASEVSMRDAQTLNQCLVDPTGTHYCLVLYEGAITFIRQKKNKRGANSLDEPEQRRITELNVKASTFLYSHDSPKLAMLHQYGRDKIMELVTYKVYDGKIYSMFSANDREDTLSITDGGANLLITVPQGEEIGGKRKYVSRGQISSVKKKPTLGGVIVVGETTLTYYDDESKSSDVYALKHPNVFVAWTPLDDLRYFLADEFGGLHLLSIITDGNDVTNMEVVEMGKISMPTSMVLLDDGLLFIASHVGDSQLLKLKIKKNALPSFEIIQTMSNLGPIMDFGIMDLGQNQTGGKTTEFSSGQARIVAGCGGYETGSLQSIRSGIGLNDVGLLGDMPNIKGLFSLCTEKGSNGRIVFDDTLVISFSYETRVFRFDNGGNIEEVEEFLNFSMDERTLLVRNAASGVIQVTPSGVKLIDPESGMVTAVWKPGPGQIITAVSANESFVLVCAGGKKLVTLETNNLTEVATHSSLEEFACVFVAPAPFTSMAFVGLWGSQSIQLMDLTSLRVIHDEPLTMQDTAAIPRSLVLAQLLPKAQSGPTLLVAMSDGNVVSFDIDFDNHALKRVNAVSLGTQQAALTLIPVHSLTGMAGTQHVFASGAMASLIHASEGRIMYSAMAAEDAIVVAPFNAAAYPDTLVVASSTDVKISVLDNDRVTHVKKLHLRETVRRLTYSASERVFALGATRRNIVDGSEITVSEIRMVDEAAFESLGRPFKLGYNGDEEIVETITAHRFQTAYGETRERFVVGTSFLQGSPGANGRIVVLGIDDRKSPYLIAEHVLKGSCQRVGIVDGKIVAALTKTVTLFEYEELSNTTGSLKLVASLRTPSTPVDLAIEGTTIAITDLMKSVSVLEYVRGEKGISSKLVEVARDFDTRWGTAVGHLQGTTWVGADGSGNLKVLRQRKGVGAIEDQEDVADHNVLENVGEYHLGENVTCIRSFKVAASKDDVVVPRAFLSTSEGSVYVLATISDDDQFEFLHRLQEHILMRSVPLGDRVTWHTWRAFTPSQGTPLEKIKVAPERFIDGEVIESFLKLSRGEQEQVCAGLLPGQGDAVARTRVLLEELRRLR